MVKDGKKFIEWANSCGYVARFSQTSIEAGSEECIILESANFGSITGAAIEYALYCGYRLTTVSAYPENVCRAVFFPLEAD